VITGHLRHRRDLSAYSDVSRSPPEGLIPEFNKRRTELYQLNARLVIRLGREHPVTKAFGRCLRLTDETRARMDAMWESHESFEVLAFDQDQRWSTYWEAYERYTDAAQQLVGARLGVVVTAVAAKGLRIEM
jgi:hypothetical protein